MQDMEGIEIVKPLSDQVCLVSWHGERFVMRKADLSCKSVYKKLKSAGIPGIPNIVFIEEESGHLMVLEEYVQGPDLETLSLNSSRIVDIMDRLCDTVSRIHSLGIVHRDIKPEHIIINGNNVTLLDFGSARTVSNKSTDTVLLGTPGYASPEQYGFAQSDARSDIYALGKVLEGLDEKGDFKRVVRRATQMDPKNRYKTVKEMQEDLKGNLYIIPGWNNPTLTGKILSILYTLAVIFIAFSVTDDPNDSFSQQWLLQLVCGLWLYFPLLAVCNLNLARNLPMGKYLLVRILYAIGAVLSGCFVTVLISAIIESVC